MYSKPTVCLLAGLWPFASALAAQPDPGPGKYPDRPVRVVVPVAAGGGTDIIARIVMSKLSDHVGKSFVIDNRSGAGGLLGNEVVARSQPDGYTLLFTYAAHTIVPFIYSRIPYDVHKDFVAVTMVGVQPLLLAAHPGVKASTVRELVGYARANPGTLNVALASSSSSGALAAELFKMITTTQMTLIPFKGGGQAMTALIAGEVQLMFATPQVVIPYLKSGRVKVLGVTGKERVSYLPDVATLTEAGIKDLNTAPWQGLMAPAKTPPAIIDYLYRQILEVLKTPYAQERFAAAGTDIVGSSPKQFGELIDRELAQNSRVIRAVGMKAE
ncbi:MAG: tripartite tricarboxylate transporter substrate binding protein [Proteobacteria bacterium]|nr:tripartite tricarboxylate transporter substrate binding protein [Burkholderiales bacterium]